MLRKHCQCNSWRSAHGQKRRILAETKGTQNTVSQAEINLG